MKKHFTLLVLATLSAGIGVRLAQAAAGDIYNLAYGTYGNDINDAGQVTGLFHPIDSITHRAFRYDGVPGAGGVMHDLGTFGGTIWDYSRGGGINNAGQVVGSSGSALNDEGRAFLYTGTPGSGGAMVDLGTLGGTNSGVSAINDAGQMAGTSDIAVWPGDVAEHAFLYIGTPGSGGAMVDLGTLGGTNSGVSAINDAGQMAGSSDIAGDVGRHAFLYTGTPGSGGTMADLGTLGGKYSGLSAINNAGQATGGSYLSYLGGDVISHAIRYSGTPGSGGTMVDLGTLGGTSSSGLDINEAGFIVGFADRSTGGDERATLWLTDAANTIVDLDAWLDATNPTLGAYWMLTQAHGINTNGLITGRGTYNDGPGGLDDGPRASSSTPPVLLCRSQRASHFWLLVCRFSLGAPRADQAHQWLFDSIADHSAQTKEESHDETLDGPCYGVAGHAARTVSPRPRSLAPTFSSGSTSTPPTQLRESSKARCSLPVARA